MPGLAAASANGWVDDFTDTVWVALHTGDPGASGTAEASAETTRSQATFAAASVGAAGLTGTLPSWPGWDQGPETISHLSLWSASTSGTFKGSVALSGAIAVDDGDSLTVSVLTVAVTGIV